MQRSHSSIRKWEFGLILAVVSLIYFPSIVSKYLWSDDYSAFVDPESVGMHAIKDGRLLYGLAINQLYNLTQEVDQVRFIRLLTIISISLLIYLSVNRLRSADSNKHLITLSILCFSLPAWANVAYWSIAFIIPISALLSAVGLEYVYERKIHCRIFGGFLLILSFLSYPPATFFPLGLRFVELFLKRKDLKKSSRVLFRDYLVLMSFLLISHMINSFLLSRIFHTSSNQRVKFVSFYDLPEKVTFFVSRLFVQSFRFFSVSSPKPVEAAIQSILVLILLFIYFLKFQSDVKKAAQWLALLFVNIFLILSIFLISADNQIEIRYFVVTNWVVGMLVLGSIQNNLIKLVSSVKILNKEKASWLLVSFLSIFAATFLSLKFYYELPKEISRETQSFIERELEACDLETKGLTVFIIARESIWPSVAVIGMGSQVTDLASSWVPESAIRAFIGKEKSIRIADLANPPKKDSISKTCIVDLNRYSEGETK